MVLTTLHGGSGLGHVDGQTPSSLPVFHHSTQPRPGLPLIFLVPSTPPPRLTQMTPYRLVSMCMLPPQDTSLTTLLSAGLTTAAQSHTVSYHLTLYSPQIDHSLDAPCVLFIVLLAQCLP